jgi:glycogen synthase
MQRRAMRKRFGWDVAAAEYAKVYEWAVEDRTGVRRASGPHAS